MEFAHLGYPSRPTWNPRQEQLGIYVDIDVVNLGTGAADCTLKNDVQASIEVIVRNWEKATDLVYRKGSRRVLTNCVERIERAYWDILSLSDKVDKLLDGRYRDKYYELVAKLGIHIGCIIGDVRKHLAARENETIVVSKVMKSDDRPAPANGQLPRPERQSSTPLQTTRHMPPSDLKHTVPTPEASVRLPDFTANARAATDTGGHGTTDRPLLSETADVDAQPGTVSTDTSVPDGSAEPEVAVHAHNTEDARVHERPKRNTAPDFNFNYGPVIDHERYGTQSSLSADVASRNLRSRTATTDPTDTSTDAISDTDTVGITGTVKQDTATTPTDSDERIVRTTTERKVVLTTAERNSIATERHSVMAITERSLDLTITERDVAMVTTDTDDVAIVTTERNVMSSTEQNPTTAATDSDGAMVMTDSDGPNIARMNTEGIVAMPTTDLSDVAMTTGRSDVMVNAEGHAVMKTTPERNEEWNVVMPTTESDRSIAGTATDTDSEQHVATTEQKVDVRETERDAEVMETTHRYFSMRTAADNVIVITTETVRTVHGVTDSEGVAETRRPHDGAECGSRSGDGLCLGTGHELSLTNLHGIGIGTLGFGLADIDKTYVRTLHDDGG